MKNLSDYTRDNLLLVLSGPSGAGKSSVLRKMLEHPETGAGLEFSVSTTTRAPRPDEVDGKDYTFISESEFMRMKEECLFLESAHVHSDYYGTPESNIEQAFSRGCDLVLEIDVKGAMQIKEKRPDAVFMFITAPLDVLEERLRARPSNLEGEKLDKDIRLRLKDALEEMEYLPRYHYLLINKDLDECVKTIISIVWAEKNRIII